MLDPCSGRDSKILNRGCNNNLKDMVLSPHNAPYSAPISKLNAAVSLRLSSRQEITLGRTLARQDHAFIVELLDIMQTDAHRDVPTLILLRVPIILKIGLVITQLHLPSRTKSVPV